MTHTSRNVLGYRWSTTMAHPTSGGRSPSGRPPSTGEISGFSVHPRVSVRSGDKAPRERLARYCARPPFAEDQLSETADGGKSRKNQLGNRIPLARTRRELRADRRRP